MGGVGVLGHHVHIDLGICGVDILGVPACLYMYMQVKAHFLSNRDTTN